MKYLVFVIYLIVVSEWVSGRMNTNNKADASIRTGRSYYSIMGIINMLSGIIGIMLFNLFLRDKGIIPVWLFWVGFAGFAILLFTGIYYIYRMLTSETP